MSSSGKTSGDLNQLLEGLDDPQFRAQLSALVEERLRGEHRAPVTESASVPPPLPLTPTAMHAAIRESYTLEEIRANPTEASNLVTHSSSVMINGEHRLRLLPQTRADVLARAQTDEALQDILKAECERDKKEFDNVTSDGARRASAWLRCFLINDYGDLQQAPAEELRSAIAAREALALVPLKGVPPVAEVRRFLELSEITEPLRILIGATGGWEGTPRVDRFAGRKAEIRTLRAFVDELRSESALEALRRAAHRVVDSVSQLLAARGPGVFVIEALGGLGKSSLIAKFVLDHALGQSSQFPFAYLDFDRASLQPREPLLLLCEVARQVGLQYPEYAPEIGSLRASIQSDLTSQARFASGCFGKFRELVAKRIVGGRRAFLVVFDTMEVVQYDPRALQGVVSFAQQLFGEGFPELRMVAAGRADIPELREASPVRESGLHLKLGPLAVDEARDMANRLGTALMGSEWQTKWSSRLVGRPAAAAQRREPLTIRVGVELLNSVKDSAEREKLSASIEKEGEQADDSFVATLYKRRLLDHVRDEDARQLAWRGLVLRRITLELARLIVLPQCDGMDAAKLEAAFEHLSHEVWIVDREGDALRHRRELRARTLPLMRRHDREAFDRMNQEAIRYYEARVRGATNDVEAHAEWIYHRLLGGEPPVSVDRDCSDQTVSALAQAVEDFALIVPAAAGYVDVRTAQSLLPPEQIAELTPELAYEHIARTGLALGEFAELRANPVLLRLAQVRSPERLLSPDAMAASVVIQVKTGRWYNDDEKRIEARGHWAELCKFAAKFKRARARSGYSLDEVEDGLRDEVESETDNARGPWLHQQRTQDLATARLFRLPDADFYEQRLKESWGSVSALGIADMRSLRTAVVFSRVHTREAAGRWLVARKPLPDGLRRTVSTAEIRALCGDSEIWKKHFERVVGPVLQKMRLSLDYLIDPETPALRFGNTDLCEIVEEFARDLQADKSESGLRVLRRFCAARDEDWIIPFGYTISRITPSAAVTAEVSRLLRSYRQFNFRRSDPIELMQVADEASDIRGMAQLYARSGGDAATDLRRLLVQYERWRLAIDEMLAREQDRAVSSAHRRSDRPPEPGPIRDTLDPQKGRWGGRSDRGGRRLTAVLIDSNQKTFWIDLIVEVTDGTPLEGPVVFHLHDSYPKSVIHVRRIRNGRWAKLEEVSSEGVYTVGVQVKDGRGDWTGLELDLAELPNLPKRFLSL